MACLHNNKLPTAGMMWYRKLQQKKKSVYMYDTYVVSEKGPITYLSITIRLFKIVMHWELARSAMVIRSPTPKALGDAVGLTTSVTIRKNEIEMPCT